jgi:Uma2 family endonuclease
MSTASRPITDQPESDPGPDREPPGPMADWYDRSSLVGDFMVMIADQTEQEYLWRAPENRICEFIDGIVFMPSPADAWHQLDIQLLLFLFEGFAARRPIGLVLTGPTALRLRPGCFLEPDLFMLPPGGEGQIHGYYSDPPALLVVEVLSKSTRTHDLKRKSSLYRDAEVQEIYFIDDRDQIVLVERRTPQGYVTERVESGPVISNAVPGFWFDASWLWARPRANVMDCLERVLAGPPG